MPNYYSPYNFYPATYPVMGGASFSPYVNNTPAMPQQSYTQAQLKAMEWVEGEVGAKAFQMPPGWPANQPIPLWDSTETVIYLKSWSPGGFPNPMQKLRYEMPETQPQQQMLQSGAASPEYVTKDDLKALREEIQSMRDSMMNRRNQNGNNNNGQQQGKGGNSNG